MNADFSAPYFHDGRFDNYDQVIAYFDHAFELGLNAQDRADLAAYLAAVGDGVRPDYHLTGGNVLADINSFASVLDMAIPRHDIEVIGLAAQTAIDLLQDLADHYPEPRGDNSNGAQERTLARATLATLMQILQRIQSDVAAGRYNDATGEYLNYRKLSFASAPAALQAADSWSLFAQ